MKIKRVIPLMLILLLAGASAWAQTRTETPTRYLLTVNSNVRGAQVFVNAVLQNGSTPLRLTLNTGTYSITVRAAGYRDYVANINLSRNLSINANLQPVLYALTVTSNVRGSTVYVNNQSQGVAPVRVNLRGGQYAIRVQAAGHHEHNQTIQLEHDTTVNAVLQPTAYTLGISANVQGAVVYVDGNRIGVTPIQLEADPGSHEIRIEAEGYHSYSETIRVTSDTSIRADLELMTFRLNITCNVQGAEILINEERIGNAPFRIEVAQGQYALTVRAPGFYEYNQLLYVTENTNVNVNLRKQSAEVEFIIPEHFLNNSVKDPLRLFNLYIDGRKIPSAQIHHFEVDAGPRLIRIETGGLAFEAEYVFEPGVPYVLEFGFQLLLKAADGR